MQIDQQQILNYWFGELTDGFTQDNRGKLWYVASKETDSEIKDRFGSLIEQAMSKELDDWKQTPLGRLCLIILLDQFTRNVYRKTAKAFEADPYAQELCKEGIDLSQDTELEPIHAAFFYHPLEHSESLEDQELSVQKFTELQERVSQKDRVEGFVKYAKEHRDLIKQFGRFPHRNEVLSRKSTAEEESYLTDGHRFGQ